MEVFKNIRSHKMGQKYFHVLPRVQAHPCLNMRLSAGYENPTCQILTKSSCQIFVNTVSTILTYNPSDGARRIFIFFLLLLMLITRYKRIVN